MSNPTPTFKYPPDLQEYAVPAEEFLRQHPEHHILCTGVAVFNKEGKLLLVQRAADEQAFPNCWEVPGGKVDDTDETILHAAARELKEESGLTATRVVRKVAEFTFGEKPGRHPTTWLKVIFEMEVEDISRVTLDPIEHQKFLFASEAEVVDDMVGDVQMVYASPPSRTSTLEAFRLKNEARSS